MCRRRAGATAGGGRRAAGREVPGWLASAPSSVPLLRPLQGQALGGPPHGKREGSWRPSRPGHALDRGPSSPGPWRLPQRRPGSAPRAGAPAPRPWGSSGGAAAALGGGSVPASMVPPFPLPQVASGACGLRGGNRGPRAPYSPGVALGLKPRGLVTGRGNFPKPEPELEHPPPPPRPLIPLPLLLLRLLPLPPTRIFLCLTDGAVSQWKAGTDLPGIGKPMVGARGRKGAGLLPTS